MTPTDYLRASNGSGESVRCIVVADRGVGDMVFNNTTPTNWNTYFIAMAGTVDPTTDRFVEGQYIVFKGHLDGSAITIDELAPGYTDFGNQEDDIIVIKPTTLWADIVAAAVDEATNGSLHLDQTTPQQIINGIPTIDAQLSDFTDSNQLVNKEYVDSTRGFEQTYFFNNTASDIGGIYYKMLDTPTGEAESTFVSGALAAGDGQALYNFVTEPGSPGTTVIKSGIYMSHIHAKKASSGGKPVKIYFSVYNRTLAGAETLIATSEISPYLTTNNMGYELHANVISDITVLSTDRQVIKWFANVEATGTDAIVTLFAEGTNNSNLSVPTTTEILSSVFVRYDVASIASATWVKDEDDMASNSATTLPTQQSVKAYVDSIMSAQSACAKEGTNASNVTITSTTAVTVASVTITASRNVTVLVNCLASLTATNDTECTPLVYRDSKLISTGPNGAIVATGSGRYIQRGVNALVELNAGTTNIYFKMSGSAGTITIPAGRGEITTSLAIAR